MSDLDIGDRDSGDLDPTEVPRKPLNAWHPSHLARQLPSVGNGPTAAGRECLAGVRQLIRQPTKPPTPSKIAAAAWRSTPEPFRRLVARAAGLSLDVVKKQDRELTETEKALIRAAAQRLRERADALFAI
jgi:hypothetical protein